MNLCPVIASCDYNPDRKWYGVARTPAFIERWGWIGFRAEPHTPLHEAVVKTFDDREDAERFLRDLIAHAPLAAAPDHHADGWLFSIVEFSGYGGCTVAFPNDIWTFLARGFLLQGSSWLRDEYANATWRGISDGANEGLGPWDLSEAELEFLWPTFDLDPFALKCLEPRWRNATTYRKKMADYLQLKGTVRGDYEKGRRRGVSMDNGCTWRDPEDMTDEDLDRYWEQLERAMDFDLAERIHDNGAYLEDDPHDSMRAFLSIYIHRAGQLVVG